MFSSDNKLHNLTNRDIYEYNKSVNNDNGYKNSILLYLISDFISNGKVVFSTAFSLIA